MGFSRIVDAWKIRSPAAAKEFCPPLTPFFSVLGSPQTLVRCPPPHLLHPCPSLHVLQENSRRRHASYPTIQRTPYPDGTPPRTPSSAFRSRRAPSSPRRRFGRRSWRWNGACGPGSPTRTDRKAVCRGVEEMDRRGDPYSYRDPCVIHFSKPARRTIFPSLAASFSFDGLRFGILFGPLKLLAQADSSCF